MRKRIEDKMRKCSGDGGSRSLNLRLWRYLTTRKPGGEEIAKTAIMISTTRSSSVENIEDDSV